MKFDEKHFENAKGHATNRLSNAELALDNNRLEYARMALNDAHSYLVTMRYEAEILSNSLRDFGGLIERLNNQFKDADRQAILED